MTYYCPFNIYFFQVNLLYTLLTADCCLCTVTYSVERMILIVATWLKFLFAVTTSVTISTSWYLKWRMSLVVEELNIIVTCDSLFISSSKWFSMKVTLLHIVGGVQGTVAFFSQANILDQGTIKSWFAVWYWASRMF